MSVFEFALVSLLVRLIGLGLDQSALAAVVLVDDKPINSQQEISSIANIVCDETSRISKQMSRISTIERLVEYFNSAPEEHELRSCINKHTESLGLLHKVLTTSNENVCSAKKIDLIEDYHNRFVTTEAEQAKIRQEQGMEMGLPMLNMFFMHYAMEVNAICQTTLIDNLINFKRDLKDISDKKMNEKVLKFNENLQFLKNGPFDERFDGLLSQLMKMFSVEQYDDVVMIWDALEATFLSESGECTKNIEVQRGEERAPVTDEPIRMFIKVKNAKNLIAIQEHCRLHLKPFYSKLIMPVMRLANLGYSNNGERFEIELRELRSNPNVKRWYAATQLCEVLLPIKVYEDVSMEIKDIIVLKREEAEELEQQQQPDGGTTSDGTKSEEPSQMLDYYEPQTNTMERVDRLESIGTMEAQQLVTNIKLNTSARDRNFGRMVAHLIKWISAEFKSSQVGRFFFPQTSEAPSTDEHGKAPVREDIAPALVATFEDIEEEDILNMRGGGKRKGVVCRRKRRERLGDINYQLTKLEELTTQKTRMSWGEMFEPIVKFFKSLMPSRFQLIVGGAVIIGIMLLVAATSMLGLSSILLGLG
jgi:hypothetical protein